MARNEEKQLARLNRYYLEKQKQEELKKRPPRPRLDTLNTPRELRKWLPTITRDIEFYVKQMEVTCYTDSKIEEFQERIQRLKQEYRAYLHKLRALEPEFRAASWADRPYTTRKRHANSDLTQEGEDADISVEPPPKSSQPQQTSAVFVPIPTPVLHNMPSVVSHYNFERQAPLVWNVNPDTEDLPLQFGPSKTLAISQSAGSADEKCKGPSTNKSNIGPEGEDQPCRFGSGQTLTVSDCAMVDGAEGDSSDSNKMSRTVTSRGDLDACFGRNTHTVSATGYSSTIKPDPSTAKGTDSSCEPSRVVSMTDNTLSASGKVEHVKSCVGDDETETNSDGRPVVTQRREGDDETETNSDGRPVVTQRREGDDETETNSDGRPVVTQRREGDDETETNSDGRPVVTQRREGVSSSGGVDSQGPKEQHIFSNPLNLDYSDSSDDDL